jgi:hypothetical protein
MIAAQRKVWAQGITAGAITTFSTSMIAVLTIHESFDFSSRHGWINLAKITLIPTFLSVFHRLQRSPLPGVEIPLQAGDSAQLKNVQVTNEGMTADSATIRKAE